MPNPTHTRLAATATRLIALHGRPMQLLVSSGGNDPFSPVSTNSELDIMGLQTKFSTREIDGDLIQVRDKRILLDSTVVPTSDMRLRDKGIDYSIVKDGIEEIEPGLKSIIYKVQARL